MRRIVSFPDPAQTRIEILEKRPLLALPILLLAAVFLTGSIWITLLILFAGVYLVAFGWVRLLRDEIHIRRTLRRRMVAVGDRLEETFELISAGRLPLLWVEIVDHSTVPGYNASVARGVENSRLTRWVFTAHCTRRGFFQVGPWEVTTGDPFGLFRLVLSFPTVDEVTIHPPIHTELTVRLPAGRRSGGVRGREKALRAAVNVAGVREYQVNDPLRWIHWPISARQNKLFVRQFDQDASGDIWLLLDFNRGVQLGQGLDGTEEHAVLLAASLASEAIFDNRAAGLAIYGPRPTLLPPAAGEGQQWQILQALARQRAEGEIPLLTALADLARSVRRGTAIVVVTPDLSGSWLPGLLNLGRSGAAVTAVLFDRESFGGQGRAEPLREQILRLGHSAHVVRQGEIGRPLQTERADEVVYRMTPMGKVIAVRRASRA